MKKWFMGVVAAAVVLSSCGTAEEGISYTNGDDFTHKMEGVNVLLSRYSVASLTDVTEEYEQLGFAVGDMMLSAVLTVQNNTAAPIYYSPNFSLLMGNEQLMSANFSADSVMIEPGEAAAFNEMYRIPDALYEAERTATMQVPVAFKLPNSTSSGDALGDFGEWTLPMK
ncbi:MAG: hypothetical protein UHX00_02860 [Caryophanon sp.]|nr:hypothetical protein [Caryophanon sp.]